MNKSTLLEELHKIELRLEDMQRRFSKYLDAALSNSQFENAPKPIDDISEKVAAATHEQAAILSFQRVELQNLLQYLEFIQEYQDFTEQDIKTVLETESTPELFRQLKQQSRQHDHIDYVSFADRAIKMKADWKNRFGNSKLEKISGKKDGA